MCNSKPRGKKDPAATPSTGEDTSPAHSTTSTSFDRGVDYGKTLPLHMMHKRSHSNTTGGDSHKLNGKMKNLFVNPIFVANILDDKLETSDFNDKLYNLAATEFDKFLARIDHLNLDLTLEEITQYFFQKQCNNAGKYDAKFSDIGEAAHVGSAWTPLISLPEYHRLKSYVYQAGNSA